MSHVKDVKSAQKPQIPPASDADMLAHVVAADTWCCSSCESMCEGVPCMGSVCEMAHEVWNNLVYFVQWVFGYTVFQRIESFYESWIEVEHVTRKDPQYEAHQARWAADLRALPEELLLAMLDEFSVGSDGRPSERIKWPKVRSKENEPFNAEEREAILEIMGEYHGDVLVLGFALAWIDAQKARDLPDNNARIDFLHQLWPQQVEMVAGDRNHVERIRWKHNLKLIDDESFRSAMLTWTNATYPGEKKKGHPGGAAMVRMQHKLDDLPGATGFMGALLQYKQQAKS